MTTIDPQQTLADMVLRQPELAAPMEKFGLDYCCGGNIALVDAVSEAGLDLQEVLDSFSATEKRQGDQDWNTLTLKELADHIESTHHAYLHEELPRLCALAEKVEMAHGRNHPELLKLAQVVRAIRADFEPHLMKEEKVLFPLIRQLSDASLMPDVPFGDFSQPIKMMCAEHESTGEFLKEIREITSEYELPDDACTSFTTLYANLQALELDTHTHIHKENNILFPKTLEKEEELSRVGA